MIFPLKVRETYLWYMVNILHFYSTFNPVTVPQSTLQRIHQNFGMLIKLCNFWNDCKQSAKSALCCLISDIAFWLCISWSYRDSCPNMSLKVQQSFWMSLVCDDQWVQRWNNRGRLLILILVLLLPIIIVYYVKTDINLISITCTLNSKPSTNLWSSYWKYYFNL